MGCLTRVRSAEGISRDARPGTQRLKRILGRGAHHSPADSGNQALQFSESRNNLTLVALLL